MNNQQWVDALAAIILSTGLLAFFFAAMAIAKVLG